MPHKLEISSAGATLKGIKDENQDFHGLMLPEDHLLATKGIAAVIADGMSASYAGREASESICTGFLNDYFSTPDSWTVKQSAHKILTALNNWLYSKGHEKTQERYGLVTTFSAAVFKSTTAHLFHVGDSRIYRIRDGSIEQMTRDHRVWVSPEKNYLNRAIGIDVHLDIDYRQLPLEKDDIYLFTTDGIHDYMSDHEILDIVSKSMPHLQLAADNLANIALDTHGSQDNITCQIVQIDNLPLQEANEVYNQLTELPFPPDLEPGHIIDGYKVIRAVHASKRSQCYLAVDQESGEQVLIKTPSVNYEDDPVYIESFLLEEWVGKRLNSPNVLKTCEQTRKRHFLYHITEYIEGQTLRSWMYDNPGPGIVEVRSIIEQVSRGLRAFHRLEMIHQDLKPENIMIDGHGTVKIIDFGSTKIAGLDEISSPVDHDMLAGTLNYTAPEYLEGKKGSPVSDLYSMAVICYEMLTGKLPFPEAKSVRSHRRRDYIPARSLVPTLPVWIDGALNKALHHDPEKRYQEMTEFLYDLSHPNPEFMQEKFQPLLERDPISFWRWSAIIMLLCNLALLVMLVK